MKQLIQIEAKYLRSGDLVFDLRHRNLQKIEYVFCENKSGENVKHALDTTVVNVHIDYGEEAHGADNFEPNSILMILINTEELKILKPNEIR